MQLKIFTGIAGIALATSIWLYHGDGTPKPPRPKDPPVRFEPNWASIKANYKDPEWFNDAKFGIFIHWGVYAVPAFGSEWYPRNMYMDTATFSATLDPGHSGPNPVHTHHKKHWGNPKEFGYKDFIPMFKGERFDPAEWIGLFRKAGARYVVPVADHHDGFAMYKSNTTRWNAYAMGPKRDVLGELFAEGRKQGMVMGASSHYAFNWSYYNKKPHFDTSDPQYADLYSAKGMDLNAPVSEDFKRKWWARTKDLIDNYQPDILWLDFYVDIPDFAEYRPKLAAYFYNKGIDWGKEVVLQDKNFSHEAFPEGTVIYDLERGKLPGIRKLPWQTDTSIGKNSWCHVADWKSKTPDRLVDDLVDIVSKNGNLLLNVGPKADGTIPKDQQEVLIAMGQWLKHNGEAIYESEPWTVFGEGPTQVAKGHHTEHHNQELTAKDFRFTTKDGKVYAMAMAIDAEGRYLVKALGSGSPHVKGKKIKRVRMLHGGKKVEWEQTDEGLAIDTGGAPQGQYVCAFEIKL